jgi:hypothetical protein
MNDNRLPRAASETRAGGGAATQRTVGVYERPKRRAKLSPSLLIILILSALVSAVATARFLF